MIQNVKKFNSKSSRMYSSERERERGEREEREREERERKPVTISLQKSLITVLFTIFNVSACPDRRTKIRDSGYNRQIVV